MAKQTSDSFLHSLQLANYNTVKSWISRARKICMEIALIVRPLPKSVKRDYVLHNFALTATEFPTIPN